MISAIASVIEQDVSAWNEEAETDGGGQRQGRPDRNPENPGQPVPQRGRHPHGGASCGTLEFVLAVAAAAAEKRALGRLNWRNKARPR